MGKHMTKTAAIVVNAFISNTANFSWQILPIFSIISLNNFKGRFRVNFRAVWDLWQLGTVGLKVSPSPTDDLSLYAQKNSKHVRKQPAGFLICYCWHLGTGESVARFPRAQLITAEVRRSEAMVFYISNDGAANTVANVHSIG